ncbi:MAG: hypothetical protein ACP5C4_05995 [Methanomicrobiales archaeon]
MAPPPGGGEGDGAGGRPVQGERGTAERSLAPDDPGPLLAPGDGAVSIDLHEHPGLCPPGGEGDPGHPVRGQLLDHPRQQVLEPEGIGGPHRRYRLRAVHHHLPADRYPDDPLRECVGEPVRIIDRREDLVVRGPFPAPHGDRLQERGEGHLSGFGGTGKPPHRVQEIGHQPARPAEEREIDEMIEAL